MFKSGADVNQYAAGISKVALQVINGYEKCRFCAQPILRRADKEHFSALQIECWVGKEQEVKVYSDKEENGKAGFVVVFFYGGRHDTIIKTYKSVNGQFKYTIKLSK